MGSGGGGEGGDCGGREGGREGGDKGGGVGAWRSSDVTVGAESRPTGISRFVESGVAAPAMIFRAEPIPVDDEVAGRRTRATTVTLPALTVMDTSEVETPGSISARAAPNAVEFNSSTVAETEKLAEITGE